MSDPRTIQREQIISGLHRHARVAHQNLASGEPELEQLRQTLPFLVPFGKAEYHGFVSIMDWDHRLPSAISILRIYAYYTEASYRKGTAQLELRISQIAARDKFPEFDVPDYAGIVADEAYEAEVDSTGKADRVRLVSPWRREIEPQDAHVSVQLARRSEEFKKLAGKMRRRPDYLGDLEAVCWTPPCESAHPSWTIDVWYLIDLSASVGKGRSFLVDLQANKVVGVREFVVRSS